MRRLAILLVLITACSREASPPANIAAANEQEAQANGTVPVPIPGNAESPPAQPAPLPPQTAESHKTPEAAASVLRDYFARIEREDFIGAHRLWSAGADDLSDGAFAASFDKYRSYHAIVGAPGPMEGAAGSSYIDIPVTVTGELESGQKFRLAGPVTLRRVNDVPGATAEQLQWRIMRTALKATP